MYIQRKYIPEVYTASSLLFARTLLNFIIANIFDFDRSRVHDYRETFAYVRVFILYVAVKSMHITNE